MSDQNKKPGIVDMAELIQEELAEIKAAMERVTGLPIDGALFKRFMAKAGQLNSYPYIQNIPAEVFETALAMYLAEQTEPGSMMKYVKE